MTESTTLSRRTSINKFNLFKKEKKTIVETKEIGIQTDKAITTMNINLNLKVEEKELNQILDVLDAYSF